MILHVGIVTGGKTVNKCHNKIGFIVFLALSFLCMWLIFMFSYQSGESSEGVSLSFYDIFISLTGFDFISHDAFRKIAHFSEFAALSFCFSGSFYFFKNETKIIVSWLLATVYAVTDEIHQLFVPERACRVFDVFVDSAGALTGAILFGLTIILYKIIFVNNVKERGEPDA